MSERVSEWAPDKEPRNSLKDLFFFYTKKVFYTIYTFYYLQKEINDTLLKKSPDTAVLVPPTKKKKWLEKNDSLKKAVPLMYRFSAFRLFDVQSADLVTWRQFHSKEKRKKRESISPKKVPFVYQHQNFHRKILYEKNL